MRRFLGTHHSVEGPLPDLGFYPRPIAGRFELHPRPCLKHHARDDFNADTTEPARPQIVKQNSGRVLVGDGNRGQLARTLLQEINRFTGLATVAFATFHVSLHLQQSALHTDSFKVSWPQAEDRQLASRGYHPAASRGPFHLALGLGSAPSPPTNWRKAGKKPRNRSKP